MKTAITYFLIFISLSAYAQNNYSYWDTKLSKDKNLKKLKVLNEVARQRIETNYYGDNLKISGNIDKDCTTDQIKLTSCLKKIGLKHPEEYAKSMFEQQRLMLTFRKENPDFFKLDREIQFKLFKKYVVSDKPYGVY